MPDPVSNIFQTTLLILYFTTPASTVPQMTAEQKKVYEAKKIWTLQSTSEVPTENPNMCVAIGTNFFHEFTELGNLTIRAYCLCPEKVIDNDACFNKRKKDAEIAKSIESKGLRAPPPSGTIIRLGPNSTLSNPEG